MPCRKPAQSIEAEPEVPAGQGEPVPETGPDEPALEIIPEEILDFEPELLIEEELGL